MINEKYADYAWEQTAALLAIDSPSGFTRRAAEWVKTAFEALGFPAKITTKGGVLADLGGENADDGLFLEAHSDTLGAMVAQIKGSGRLRLTAVGGMEPNNAEAENVRIYTRSGKVYDGTCQLCNASVHVNGEYGSTKRSYDTVEVVPDENVSTAEDTRKLGIEVGDFVCFDPRTRRTASGYLKSRFLDDKLSVGILLGQAVIIPMTAYGLSRYRFKGRDALFFLVLVLMLLPFQVTMAPSVMTLRALGILNTPWAVILPMWFSPFYLFLVRQFMLGLPNEILEAGQMDGAGAFRCLWQVVLPVCRPIIGASVALSFADCWNLVEQPLIYLTDSSQQPLRVMFNQINTDSADVAFAGAALYILPMLLVYLYFQDDILLGVQLSELK